jgi:opacity protein-like surface antigen
MIQRASAFKKCGLGRTAAAAPLLLVLVLVAGGASAQAPPAEAGQVDPQDAVAVAERGRPSVEVAGGILWLGGSQLGRSAATLTPNQITPGAPFTLFDTESSVQPVAGYQVRLGYRLSRLFLIEGGVVYSRPEVRTEIRNDAEATGATFTAVESMSEYIFEGSLVVNLTRLQFQGGRGMPFASAGAGYVRQLHDGNTLVETGTAYHVGGGLKYAFTSGRRRIPHSIGLRGEARLYVRDGGFQIAEERRSAPVATVGLFVGF